MRIRKSPWGRCGSWRWLAWDTGMTWRPPPQMWAPVMCRSFLKGAILGLGEQRARGHTALAPSTPQSGSGSGRPM